MQLIYVMDPMCAWCYGFEPELEAFMVKYPLAQINWVMGGLAPDNNQPMDDQLKQSIASYWHQIQSSTQVSFNHDYWKLNTPYRSTYPACRAVIAARNLMDDGAFKMVKAIQSSYYLKAANPSLEETLVNCAGSIGLDEGVFTEAYRSEETEQQLQQDLLLAGQLGVRGFPALFYVDEVNSAYPLTMGYCTAAALEDRLNQIKNNT